MKHRVAVNQSFRVHRSIVMEVEAEDAHAAAELVDTGEIDKPDFDDPCWHSSWEHVDETVDPL